MRKNRGLSLVEVMVCISIAGMLASISMPTLAQRRREAKYQTIVSNLQAIEEAKIRWSLENHPAWGAEPDTTELVPLYLQSWPASPSGHYSPENTQMHASFEGIELKEFLNPANKSTLMNQLGL
jgi:prepilin-type N-terminal cleavage/methylation domain-containing protein